MKNLVFKFIFMLSIASLFSLAACAKPTSEIPNTAANTTANTAPSTAQSNATSATPTAAKPAISAASIAKVMVLDFPLNDLTDLPNPPEEIARTADFNQYFKQRLADDGIELVPVTDNIEAVAAAQSATYLFDHPDIAADLAKGSGADYILIGVAMKPTYLFVYPRLLLVEIATKRKAFTAYVQMEGSWLEKTTTANSAQRLAEKVSIKLKELAK